MHYQESETVELMQEFSESIPCWFETMQRRKAEVYTVISFHFHCKRGCLTKESEAVLFL